jgi:hypothetical protein
VKVTFDPAYLSEWLAFGDVHIIEEWVYQTSFAGGDGNVITTDPAKKIAAFTAESWKSYLIDTSAGSFSITMPASPMVGDQIGFCDLAGTFGTNNLTLLGNGNSVLRDPDGAVLDIDNWNSAFLFTGQEGWLPSNT